MIRVLKIGSLVSVVVLINAVTTLLFVQSAAPASAGPNCVNGDVNGDFVVDITDPIHLLGYIFEGAPVPVACAQNPSDVFVINSPTVKLTDGWDIDSSVTINEIWNGSQGKVSIYTVPASFRFCLTDITCVRDGGNSIAGNIYLWRNFGLDMVFATALGHSSFNPPRHFSNSFRTPIVFEAGDEIQVSGTSDDFQAITRTSINGYLVPITNP